MSTLRDIRVAIKADTTRIEAAFERMAEALARFTWPRFFVVGTAADPFARPKPLCIDGREYRRRRNRRRGR